MKKAWWKDRTIEPWSDAWSDGCSVPAMLRLVVRKETAAECEVCVHHDEAYYYGGSRARRRAADRVFHRGLIDARTGRAKAWWYWFLVSIQH